VLERVIWRGLTSRPLWLVLGLANMTAGVVIALRPNQSFDVEKVAQWCREWLILGVNPYSGVDIHANYPPYALVLLSPLALLPAHLVNAAWAIISAVMAVVAGWLGLNLTDERPIERSFQLSIGFFLAWGSVRIDLGLGQFTLVAFVCGLAAVRYPGKIGRGMLLGIAMIKPQVGAAFVLWAILEGALSSVLWAVAPIVIGTLLFAARLGQSPSAVLGLYGDILRNELAAPGFREGALELRPLIHGLIAQPTVADAIHLGIVGASLLLLVVASRRMNRAGRALFVLPLTCLWTLMSVYHPAYDFVLLWPVAVAISVCVADVSRKAVVLGAIAAVQLVLVVDVPGLWWKLNGRPAPHAYGLLTTAVMHFDRLLVVALFAALVTLSFRWHPADHPVTLPGHAIPAS